MNFGFQRNLKLLVWICLSIILTACNNNDSSGEKPAQAVTQLNSSNIAAFTSSFKKDYDDNLNALLKEFKLAQQNNDEYSFVDYRNNKWTPAYISKKNFYAKVYEDNSTYLKTSPITPLFNHFENLIYIGLELKNGLLDKDQDAINRALADAKAQQKSVHAIGIKSK